MSLDRLRLRSALAILLGASSLAVACGNTAPNAPVAVDGGAKGSDAGAADAGSTEAATAPCPSAPEVSLAVWKCPPVAPAEATLCCGGQGTVCSYDCSGGLLLDQSFAGAQPSCLPTEAGCIPASQTVAATCEDSERYQVDRHACHATATDGGWDAEIESGTCVEAPSLGPSDLSCDSDQDCASVWSGTICSCGCNCGRVPGNTAAHARVGSALGSVPTCSRPPDGCGCPASGIPRCFAHRCALCYDMPNQPAACDADAAAGDGGD